MGGGSIWDLLKGCVSDTRGGECQRMTPRSLAKERMELPLGSMGKPARGAGFREEGKGFALDST